jgi:hypothetical protein
MEKTKPSAQSRFRNVEAVGRPARWTYNMIDNGTEIHKARTINSHVLVEKLQERTQTQTNMIRTFKTIETIVDLLQ